jgi:eukaryotic-like serine/threonine-protein kinase
MYMVMEFMSGGSLRTVLDQRGRLTVDDAVRIAADICEGLAAAHAKGIVHRDIKPENILLTADGRAKIGDFGIAHVPHAAGGAYVGGLTEAGFQPGTLIYMSPEQICGEAVDGRSDVYQAGALLFEMLTGQDCIDIEALTRRAQETTGGNVLRMQARLYDLLEDAICKQEPQDVCSLRPDVPGWLGATVAAALSRPTVSRLGCRIAICRTRRSTSWTKPAPALGSRRSASLLTR